MLGQKVIGKIKDRRNMKLVNSINSFLENVFIALRQLNVNKKVVTSNVINDLQNILFCFRKVV